MNKAINNYYSKLDMKFAYNTTFTLAYDPKYLLGEMGFRTAGSDAEHKAADYIAELMRGIGLSDVEKIPVKVDSFAFRDASLNLIGDEYIIKPASYACSGTGKEGLDAEIVFVGKGYASDYENMDVEGKIVLIEINQWDDNWISDPYREAYLQGAAALVSFDSGGYAGIADDAVNLQDICENDLMPNVSISASDGAYLKEKIKSAQVNNKSGQIKAHLYVDSKISIGDGVSYNVIGKIPGKSSKQQIIFAGHYDVYFNGFQDDCAAIGLILTVAKAMVDSGYKPQNDILFVAHGAEEWGASGSRNDWTTGAWRMINEINPDWADNTLALFNFELPALYVGDDFISISCVPEYSSLVTRLVTGTELLGDQQLFRGIDTWIFKNGISPECVPVNTLEDGMSYRFAGVPYFVNKPEVHDKWIKARYHTKYDNADTWSEDVMRINAQIFGALAMYIDNTPRIGLDFAVTADSLLDTFDEELGAKIGADVEGFENTVSEFKEAILEYMNSEVDSEQYNKIMLKIFKIIQDKTIGIIGTSAIVNRHECAQHNINLIQNVLNNLDDLPNALEYAAQVNAFNDAAYLKFSKETADKSKAILYKESNPDNTFWGTDKVDPMPDTYEGIIALMDGDSEKAKTVYEKALEHDYEVLKNSIAVELDGLKKCIELL